MQNVRQIVVSIENLCAIAQRFSMRGVVTVVGMVGEEFSAEASAINMHVYLGGGYGFVS